MSAILILNKTLFVRVAKKGEEMRGDETKKGMLEMKAYLRFMRTDSKKGCQAVAAAQRRAGERMDQEVLSLRFFSMKSRSWSQESNTK